MTSISQTQIATYLHDYNALTALMLKHKDEQPFKLFQKHLLDSNRLEDANETYYQRMLNIAYIFTKMKSFSIAEDYTLKNKNNFINNDDLELSFLDSKITGNRSIISNKRLLQMIRDGFNHSSSNHELYKISPNCKYIEFSFQNPTPITIKLSITDIANLTFAIGNAARTFQFFSFDQPTGVTIKDYVTNLKITRHYFPKKLAQTTMNTVFKLQEENNHKDAIIEVKSIERSIEKEIKLSDIQINRILMNIKNLINQGILTPEEFKDNVKDFVIVLLTKELPIPALKFEHYSLDSYFIGMILPHKIFSYNKSWKIFNRGLSYNTPNSLDNYMDMFDKHRELLYKVYYSDDDEKLTYSTLLFVEYVLSNFKPDEEFIKIGHKTIEYRKLRNSLVHGRWHIEREKVVFYDTLPNIENELDYNWIAKLDLAALHTYCSNILQRRLYDKNPKEKKKTILEI